MRMTQRSWMTLVLAILTVSFLQESLGLSSSASLIPRTILSLTLLLLIVQLLLDVKSSSSSHAPADGTIADQSGTSVPTDQRAPAWRVVLWLAILPTAIWLFGVVAGAAMYCLIFMKWYAFEPWKTSLIFAITLGLVIQLLFAVILRVTLYGGVIVQAFA